jgi:hypothetical protein
MLCIPSIRDVARKPTGAKSRSSPFDVWGSGSACRLVAALETWRCST